MNFLWFIGLLCLSVSSVKSQNELIREGKRQPAKYCGKQLSNILLIVCQSKYNKRTSIDYASDDYVYEQPQDFAWPFLSRQSASSLLATSDQHRRFRRGLVDECCHKSCTLNELQSYCAA